MAYGEIIGRRWGEPKCNLGGSEVRPESSATAVGWYEALQGCGEATTVSTRSRCPMAPGPADQDIQEGPPRPGATSPAVELRHGAATLASWPPGRDLRVVQEMLGHSRIVLTP